MEQVVPEFRLLLAMPHEDEAQEFDGSWAASPSLFDILAPPKVSFANQVRREQRELELLLDPSFGAHEPDECDKACMASDQVVSVCTDMTRSPVLTDKHCVRLYSRSDPANGEWMLPALQMPDSYWERIMAHHNIHADVARYASCKAARAATKRRCSEKRRLRRERTEHLPKYIRRSRIASARPRVGGRFIKREPESNNQLY
ncbi:hypothetical protein FVE85_0983 [Porphyridium purpureum]|uniref:CCT domain-containing protein n=1 Tax=Porphyridium purpureum TaxID=35688 RepID=A0A5J4Z2T9_PORPP|nr:hypothetical protein FVE85_0983 [Porphyridium purpureum]|eukprot:POR3898..scf208_2